jgi:hypothetical protein
MKKPPYEADVATQVRKLTADIRRLREELRAQVAERHDSGAKPTERPDSKSHTDAHNPPSPARRET